jgi:hypothetical protein
VIVLAHQTRELTKRDRPSRSKTRHGLSEQWHFDEPPGSLLDASRDKPSIETTGRLQSAQVVATTRAEQAAAAQALLQLTSTIDIDGLKLAL